MRTKKALLSALCAGLLVVGSVMGTMAYLTDYEKVENTFTVGHVDITMDEAKANADGSLVENAARVKENEYHLLPGHTYAKDPTVHVEAGSEDCYIFVKIENGIAAIESTADSYASIADQVSANGWTKLDGVDNVYYQEWAKGSADVDLEIFANFTIGAEQTNDTMDDYGNAKVDVTAYAVQKDGLNVTEAWGAISETAYNVPSNS